MVLAVKLLNVALIINLSFVVSALTSSNGAIVSPDRPTPYPPRTFVAAEKLDAIGNETPKTPYNLRCSGCRKIYKTTYLIANSLV